MSIEITINLWTLLIVVSYLLIGGIFVWGVATNPQAVVVLVLFWPIFAILMLLAPVINYIVNRNET